MLSGQRLSGTRSMVIVPVSKLRSGEFSPLSLLGKKYHIAGPEWSRLEGENTLLLLEMRIVYLDHLTLFGWSKLNYKCN